MNKDGKVGVMVRISLNGHRTQFSSKLTVTMGIYITVEKIRDAYLGVTASVQMLLIVFKKHNEELKLRIGKDIL